MARVLIVDDDQDVLESIEAELEESGHQPLGVRSADRALASGPESFDVILIDLWMRPGLSGLGLKRELDERKVTVPAVLMSSDDEVGAQSVSAGFTEYLHKPFSPDQLHAAIARAVSDSPAVSTSQQPAVVPTDEPSLQPDRGRDEPDS
jgi:DNA-binding NtrC family response regulator